MKAVLLVCVLLVVVGGAQANLNRLKARVSRNTEVPETSAEEEQSKFGSVPQYYSDRGQNEEQQQAPAAASADMMRFREVPVVAPASPPVPRFAEVMMREPSSASEKSESEEQADKEMKKSSQADKTAKKVDQEHDEVVKNMHVSDDDVAEEEKEKELDDALQSVKDQIVDHANQIKSEKLWVKEVTKIIESYVHKTRRVNANIRDLQKAVKILFRKKKQVENMILQRKLERKLKIATKDLETLQRALANVQKKQAAFNKSKNDIKQTIGAIESQLKKLRGQAKPAQEPQSLSSMSSTSSSGSSSGSSSSQ